MNKNNEKQIESLINDFNDHVTRNSLPFTINPYENRTFSAINKLKKEYKTSWLLHLNELEVHKNQLMSSPKHSSSFKCFNESESVSKIFNISNEHDDKAHVEGEEPTSKITESQKRIIEAIENNKIYNTKVNKK